MLAITHHVQGLQGRVPWPWRQEQWNGGKAWMRCVRVRACACKCNLPCYYLKNAPSVASAMK